jgi:ESS family glutamate:Na+ symporter
MITLSGWWLAVLAVPVLLLGELLHRWIPGFARFNVPISVAGGLAAAGLVAVAAYLGWPVSWRTSVAAGPWTWWVMSGPVWAARPELAFNTPLLVVFLAVSTLLAVTQNVVGIGLARLLGQSPLLGILCGAVTLTGGHGTALGFAPAFVKAGFPAAASVGAAAATFGLIAGGLAGAPAATWLIERFPRARPAAAPNALGSLAPGSAAARPALGWLAQVRAVAALGRPAWWHLAMIAACVKAGAWVSFELQRAGLIFPVYMGAMLVGLAFRSGIDALFPGLIRSEAVDRIGTVLLGLFLAATLMSLNLGDLTEVAAPMLIILLGQVVVMLLFAGLVTWPVMGRNYEAAVMAAGQIGFGLGNTATAVADMDALVGRYGPAPRAYTIVPPTGGFLIDLTNALVITAFLNLYR